MLCPMRKRKHYSYNNEIEKLLVSTDEEFLDCVETDCELWNDAFETCTLGMTGSDFSEIIKSLDKIGKQD